MLLRLRSDARLPLPHPPPAVSVVLPCRKEQQYIGRCLDSILVGEYPIERLEILVVDGMSEDGTRAIVEEYARRHSTIRLISNPKRTVPAAINLGIAQATGELILRMDAHVEYPADYISSLVRWLLGTGADNVGGACVTMPANQSATARAIAAALSHFFGIGNGDFRLGTGEPRWVDTVPFGCFRRDVFDRFGRFDEDLVRNQDDEFNHRLIRAGGRVLLIPSIRSRYYARASLRDLARMYYQYGYFKPLVVRKVGGVMTGRQLVPPVFVGTMILTAAVAPWLPNAVVVCALVAAGYAAADIVVSGLLGLEEGVRVAIVLLVVFPVLHLAYGLGYLRGCLDFLLLGKRARDVALSR